MNTQTSFLSGRLTPTQQVRLELRARPGRFLSCALLCELTGLSVLQVNSAIYSLTKQHRIIRQVPASMAGRACGQAYAWDYRGIQ